MTAFLIRLLLPSGADPGDPQVRQRCGSVSGGVGIALNALLFLGKLLSGLATGSIAVVADAFNNLSDAASSVITLVGFRLAGQDADQEHPFGHGRMEYLTGLVVALAILLMGVEIGKSSLEKIFSPEVTTFSWMAVVILFLSILVKLWMFFFNRTLGRRIGSAAMEATAADSLSDSVSTGVVLLSTLISHFLHVQVDGFAGLLVAVYLAVFLLMGGLVRRLSAKGGALEVTWRELSAAAIIGVAVFALSNLSFLTIRTPFSSQYGPEIYNVRTIMDLGGLAILYAHHLQCRELRVLRELEAVQNVLQKQYQQYQMSRDSIDLINRKYHDLKHQIMVLRAEPDAEQRETYLDQMEAEIRTYEAQNKTGNQVLDTVLTSKSLYCAQHGIGLTCVADGALLDFMEVMDLSAVFGNALDNAIECEERIADPEKRLIHVSVSAQRDFVLIRFENYCEGSLNFSEGLPVTTKEDRNFHGYGLKSIRYVAKKYGGTVTARMEKQWFVLQLLFPRPAQPKEV